MHCISLQQFEIKQSQTKQLTAKISTSLRNVRRDFLDLLDHVTRRAEQMGFQRKTILPDARISKMLTFGIVKIIEKLHAKRINK